MPKRSVTLDSHSHQAQETRLASQLPSGPDNLSKIAETNRTRASGATMPPIDMAPKMVRSPRSPAQAHTRLIHPFSAAPAASRQMTTIKPDQKK